jgi:hypothetical protein
MRRVWRACLADQLTSVSDTEVVQLLRHCHFLVKPATSSVWIMRVRVRIACMVRACLRLRFVHCVCKIEELI